jgi:hypothetical protein
VAAPLVARALHEFLSRAGYAVVLVISPADRLDVVDMNRPQSRGTKFRDEVAKFLAYKPKLHIDVHSFPDYYPLYAGQDVVLLYTEELQDEAWLPQYARLLVAAAESCGLTGFNVMVAPHQHMDDVVAHGVELGVALDANMLAEHNEGRRDPVFYGLIHAKAIEALFKARGWR